MPENGESDYEVLQGSVGEPARFAVIFERHYRQVYAFAARRLGRDQAADVTIDVFERALIRAADFRGVSTSSRAWLLGITRNVIGDRLRSSKRRSEIHPPLDYDSGFEEEAVVRLDAETWKPAIDAALETLSESDRIAFLAHVVDGFTYSEVAAALGMPLGTVASRVSRARSQLREVLSGERQIEERNQEEVEEE